MIAVSMVPVLSIGIDGSPPSPSDSRQRAPALSVRLVTAIVRAAWPSRFPSPCSCRAPAPTCRRCSTPSTAARREIVAVASSVAGAPALERAAASGRARRAVFARADYADREARDEALADWLAERGARLVVLAGYMELLGDAFLARFPGAVINVHPSLLPAFPGLARDRAGARLRREGVRRDRPLRRRRRRHRAGDPAARRRAARRARARARCSRRCARSSTRCCRRRCACSRAARSRADPEQPAPADRDPASGRRGIGSERWLSEGDADDRAAPAASSAPRRARCACAGRCCRSPTSTGSSSSRAAWPSSAWRSSPPAAPRASSPARASPCASIEDFTGFPEIMDGRVKTLHPRLYAGLLARRDDDGAPARRRRAGDRAGRPRVREPVPVRADRRPRRRRPSRRSIENIDIGGPTMIRAAAKNSALRRRRGRPGRLRARARRAARVRRAAVAATRAAAGGQGVRVHRPLRRGDRDAGSRARTYEGFPPSLARRLREGQRPALRREPAPAGRLLRARRARPRTCSTASRSCTARSCRSTTCSTSAPRASWSRSSPSPACAIVKHNNPCGCAVAASGQEAYERAFACDPQSAYGGVIAVNRRVDRAVRRGARQAVHRGAARARLRRRRAGGAAGQEERAPARAAPTGREPAAARSKRKPVIGGQLVQTRDVVSETREQMRVMSAAAAERGAVAATCCSPGRVCRHVRSNAIVIAAGGATIGIGAGQMSRVDAVRIAVEKAQAVPAASCSPARRSPPTPSSRSPTARSWRSTRASSAIIQPGGSVRDEEVVAAVDAAGVAMVATGRRHFRH